MADAFSEIGGVRFLLSGTANNAATGSELPVAAPLSERKI